MQVCGYAYKTARFCVLHLVTFALNSATYKYPHARASSSCYGKDKRPECSVARDVYFPPHLGEKVI